MTTILTHEQKRKWAEANNESLTTNKRQEYKFSRITTNTHRPTTTLDKQGNIIAVGKR